MEIYLIRHGAVDYDNALDFYSVSLTPEGLAQAKRVAELCQEWRIQFLCASTLNRAQQTADAISAAMPDVERWDLEEIEEINVDDLGLDPTAGPIMLTWTQEQVELANQRAWIRVMAALARIQVYAETYDLERIAIVAHVGVIQLLLLNWLGHDWRLAPRLQIMVEYAATCKVVLARDHVQIAWVNRLTDMI
jgi:broad specificity phosphatase PhoE